MDSKYYNKAKKYLHKSINIYIKSYGEYYKQLVDAYYYLGIINMNLNNNKAKK